MIFKVLMLAFGEPGQVREVEVPDTLSDLKGDDLLEQIFYFGQNDFQPKRCPSVSMGDVIDFNGRFFRVMAAGFKEMSLRELEEYQAIPRENRWQFGLV